MILKETEMKMEKTLHLMSEQCGHLSQSLRVGYIETIKIDYYGSQTPLQQLAAVSQPRGNMIVITPYDQGCLKDIEYAIHKANLGVGVIKEGKVVRLTLPIQSMEQRQKLTNRVKQLGEDAKIAIRNIRRDVKKVFDKQEGMSEDEAEEGKNKLQEMTDQHIVKIQEIVERKTKVILDG